MTPEERNELAQIRADFSRTTSDSYEEECCAGCYALVDRTGLDPLSEAWEHGHITHLPTCPFVRLDAFLAAPAGDSVTLPRAGVEQIRESLLVVRTTLLRWSNGMVCRREIKCIAAALALLPEATPTEPQPPCPMCGNPASAHTPRFDEGLGVEALVCPEGGCNA